MTHVPQNRVPSGVSVRFGPGVLAGESTQSSVNHSVETLQCPPTCPPTRDEPAHSHASRPMFTLAVCVLALLAYGCIVKRADAAQPHWQPASASWYQPTGNHTSCGDPFTDQSWSVSALSPSVYDCHVVITICNRHRCVRVPISDRGAWRTDGRLWDLSPRVKRALHCSDLCQVRWTR